MKLPLVNKVESAWVALREASILVFVTIFVSSWDVWFNRVKMAILNYQKLYNLF